MTNAPSATYCRCCSFRVVPLGATLPPHVTTCRCITPVPYEIIVDQGKPPAMRPRGPRKPKGGVPVAVVEAPRPMFKAKLKLSEQLARLLQIELNKRNLNADTAADKVGVHSNILRRVLKGNNWPTEENMTKICNWMGYELLLTGKD